MLGLRPGSRPAWRRGQRRFQICDRGAATPAAEELALDGPLGVGVGGYGEVEAFVEEKAFVQGELRGLAGAEMENEFCEAAEMVDAVLYEVASRHREGSRRRWVDAAGRRGALQHQIGGCS